MNDEPKLDKLAERIAARRAEHAARAGTDAVPAANPRTIETASLAATSQPVNPGIEQKVREALDAIASHGVAEFLGNADAKAGSLAVVGQQEKKQRPAPLTEARLVDGIKLRPGAKMLRPLEPVFGLLWFHSV